MAFYGLIVAPGIEAQALVPQFEFTLRRFAVGTAPSPAPAPATSGLTDNVAGMIAYITIIPAILFLVMEPYNKKSFVRFHAFQSLFFNIAWIVVWVGFSIVSGILSAAVPLLGLLISAVLWLGIGLGGFVLWIMCLLKANKGERWQLPVVGKIAEQQAGS
jgi:uncharacterized membrane protein